MNIIEKLMASSNDEKKLSNLRYANYLYNDLINEGNEEKLNDLINILLNYSENSTDAIMSKKFSSEIMEWFYQYLISAGLTKTTAYDYTRRIARICKEFDIDIMELFNCRSSYSIHDLIGMYSKGGKKYEDSIKQHNAPIAALNKFLKFMDNRKEPFYNDELLQNASIYLSDDEGYQSFEKIERHPSLIEIKNRECTITFKENRSVCEVVKKKINNNNYVELISLFRKYKDILCQSNKSVFEMYPFGGVHSYKYEFEGKSNLIGCAKLFESENDSLVKAAYEEYSRIIANIINQ